MDRQEDIDRINAEYQDLPLLHQAFLRLSADIADFKVSKPAAKSLHGAVVMPRDMPELRCLIINLYQKWHEGFVSELTPLPVRFPLNNRTWTGDGEFSRKRQSNVLGDRIRRVFYALIAKGWVSYTKGDNQGKGAETTFTSSPCLDDLFLQAYTRVTSIPEPRLRARQLTIVLSREVFKFITYSKKADGQKKVASDESLPIVSDSNKVLAEFNAMNTSHRWVVTEETYPQMSLCLDATTERTIEPRFMKFFRQFTNKECTTGGRIYSPRMSNLKSAHRRRVKVNGIHLVEWDFTSMQTMVYYHLNGLECPSECYAVPFDNRGTILNRSVGKDLMLIASNNNNKRSTVSAAFSSHGRVSYSDYSAAFDLLVSFHSQIPGYFTDQPGLKLQKLDSDIALEILRRFSALNLPLIPIHDGFYTSKDNSEVLKNVMIESYQKVLNTSYMPLMKTKDLSVQEQGVG